MMKFNIYCSMKTKLLTTAFIITIIPLAQSQQEVFMPAIEKVIVSSGIFLQIERAPQYSLSVMTQEMDSGCLIRTIEAGTLTLKLPGSADCKGKISVNLKCPFLKELEISGKADVTSSNLMVGDSLRLRLQSGSKAYLDMDIKHLDVRLIEGSLLSAKGYAVNQNVYVTTSATYSCFELEGDTISVEASMGGKAKICASKSLVALSKVGGYIGYKCNPPKITKEGSGSIEEITE
jgi:hypothetical protein